MHALTISWQPTGCLGLARCCLCNTAWHRSIGHVAGTRARAGATSQLTPLLAGQELGNHA